MAKTGLCAEHGERLWTDSVVDSAAGICMPESLCRTILDDPHGRSRIPTPRPRCYEDYKENFQWKAMQAACDPQGLKQCHLLAA